MATGLKTAQVLAMSISSANAIAEGDTGATAPLVFLFRGNPDNYSTTEIAALASVTPATSAQEKAVLGVITPVTAMLSSGAFKRVTVDGVVGTKRAKRELIVPSVNVALLVEVIDSNYAAGTPINIGTTSPMIAHGVGVGLKSVAR